MTPPETRRYDLDWLRVILFGILVPFHALIGFTDKGTYLYGYRNQDTAGVVGEWTILLLEVWHLPSLFLISGVATFFVVKRSGALAFIGNRLVRIFFPLVIGIVFWNAVIAYYQASIVFAVPSFPQFWWTRLSDLSFYRADHLWFLVNLFCYAILAIPLFQFLLQNRNGWLARVLPLITLALLLANALLVKPYGAAFDGYITWHTINYAIYYVLGFWLMVAPQSTWDRLRSMRWATLAVGIALVIGLGLLLPFAQKTDDGYNLMTDGYWALFETPWLSPSHSSYAVLYAFATLIWCATLLGFAYRYLNHPHRWLPPLNRAVYPLYIFHMIFVFVGLYYLRDVTWPWFLEFMLLTLGTFLLSTVLYLVFDSVKPLRLLVGLGPRHNKSLK